MLTGKASARRHDCGRHSPRAARPAIRTSPRAFTLVELIVVLAIIGLVLGISVPGLVHYNQQVRLKTATREIVGLVSLARSLAISSRQEHSVVVNEAAREVTLVNLDSGETLEQRVRLPKSIDIEVEVGGEPAKESRVVFRPTGSLTGRSTSFIIANRDKEHRITVTAATGAVFVQ